MLYSKEEWISIHNLHILKGYDTKKNNYGVPQKGWRLRSLNYLIKKTRETGTTAGQRQTSHIKYC